MARSGDFAFAGTPTPEELARFPRNDFGNAMRWIRMTGGVIDVDGQVDCSASKILFLRRRGWIAFNGRYWDLDQGESLAQHEAAKVAQGLMDQAAIWAEDLASKGASARAISSVWDYAVGCGNAGKMGNMINVAQAYLTVDLEAFDPDPLALNCENGVLRFRRGKNGRPVAHFTAGHDPRDRMTRMVRCAYEAGAAAPLFDQVVSAAQAKEPERHYLHRVMGYMATGSTEEQKFFVFQGRGGDGKSTIVNAVRDTLGSYATVVAVETFLDTGLRRGSEASPDIADLSGDTRLLAAGEPPSGSKLATGAIKAFTGGGRMKARELREKLFEFEPVGKPVIECNRRPTINDTDDGIWRRLKILPFEHQVPPDQVDGTLPQKLKGERPGILAWLVEGVLKWMEEGLRNEPESVKAAIEDYRKGSNPLALWMDARVIRDEGARVRATVLYNDYKSFCDDNGFDKPMSQRAFGSALGDLQIIFAGKDGDGKVTRRGARLRTPADGLAEPARGDNAALGAGGFEGSAASDDLDGFTL